MNKTFIIFRHELIQAVKKVGYIIMTLIIPVLALLAIGVFKLVMSITEPSVQEMVSIGYVDELGMFRDQAEQGFITFVPFVSTKQATKALLNGHIQEYIVIASDYITTGVVQRYTLEKELVTSQSTAYFINSFLIWNVLKEYAPPEVIGSIIAPLSLEVTRLDQNGEIAKEQGNVGNVIIPGVFALLLSLAFMFGTNSLISGLGEEKESRLIEVLLSSASVRQLLIAKVLALGAAGLLQILVWLISAPLLLGLASSTFGGFLSDIQIPANFMVLGVVYFVLGYLLFAVLSVSVGAISATTTEGHNLSMFYGLAQFIPLWFAGFLINFPKNPLWVVLALFPITAPVATMLMVGVSDVPVWQIATSIGLMALSVLVGLYLATKLVRVFMLMYGKRPNLTDIIEGLRSA